MHQDSARAADSRSHVTFFAPLLQFLPLILALSVVVGATSIARAANPAVYAVQPGDTLSAIALKLGIAEGDRDSWMRAVSALNGLASPDSLVAGQTLNLPESRASSGATSSAAGTTSQTTNYKVQAGDSLLGIAARRGVSEAGLADWVATVLKLNGLASGDLILAGQSIVLPATPAASQSTQPPATSGAAQASASPAAQLPLATVAYAVQPGDSLSALAVKLAVPESDRAT